ncbi:Ada metal-binding domain-containing protein [Chryseobacterium herbae]|uniref:Metal-binding protein n=1 Tax=Chryseobacterium herbae TaxID=2976476 RepID=A0ABT2IZ46_9FLAO|nr:Ada metal-binding domain-containing protein [Chryseobacterium sp. pc1-10]MCT2564118.1 metal-binding protein [Chryseobacterium sp. pc1-10]
MEKHTEISDIDLRRKIRHKEINFAGNRKLKIYGLLTCSSGKKMKRENRIFFISEKDALENKYRPCGHCMKEEYQLWKNKSFEK